MGNKLSALNFRALGAVNVTSSGEIRLDCDTEQGGEFVAKKNQRTLFLRIRSFAMVLLQCWLVVEGSGILPGVLGHLLSVVQQLLLLLLRSRLR